MEVRNLRVGWEGQYVVLNMSELALMKSRDLGKKIEGDREVSQSWVGVGVRRWILPWKGMATGP